MRYYAQRNENNTIIAIGTGPGGVEITEEEYNRLLAEIQTKATLVSQFYNDEITLADVPAEWQEEIQQRVDERIATEGKAAEQEISSDEFYNMVEQIL